MKEYKVESFIFYTKLTFDRNHVIKSSTAEIQAKLEERSKEGWILVSTDAVTFGAAVYHYLYFEKSK